MVTRYTVTLRPVDAFVPSVPPEYPPLFPWLVARAANLTHKPGWALLGDAEALLMSLTVLVGFLLWQRLIPAWPAVMLAIAAPLAFGQPRKAYEIFTMAVLVPCALAALCRFRRPGGMHWLVAGFALGLILQIYQGFVLFTARAWRCSPSWAGATRAGAAQGAPSCSTSRGSSQRPSSWPRGTWCRSCTASSPSAAHE